METVPMKTEVCNKMWSSPRRFQNAVTGEEFETLPVSHMCGLGRDHHGEACHCVCGVQQ